MAGQVISNNQYLKAQAEITAIEEISSYLRQKWDVAGEFTDTTVYSHTAAYKAGNRVYLSAGHYNDNKTYGLNDLTLKNGFVWVCSVAIGSPELFNPSHWTQIGVLNDIYYAIYPNPVFNINGFYAKNAIVFWKDHNYKCLIATGSLDHDSRIQNDFVSQEPFQNVFPDAANGSTYWQDQGAYTVSAGSISNTAKFIHGDNRNPQMVLYVIDVILYHLYSRISPGIIPEIRVVRYQVAMSWCNKVMKGEDIEPNLTKIQPPKGGRIRYGSREKQENYY